MPGWRGPVVRRDTFITLPGVTRWFGNRELSWLDFDERVLSLATEPAVPLLERLKFVAIFSSNLDEFFQVRVAALLDQVAAGVSSNSADGLSPQRQLSEIRTRVSELVERQESVLLDTILPQLASHGHCIVGWNDLGPDDRARMEDFFRRQVFPVLTPLAVDPAHPFPYVSNLALNLGVVVRNPLTMEQKFARVKVPTFRGRFLPLGGGRFLPVEDLVAANIGELFEGMQIVDVGAFRVTRSTDLTVENEDADDLLAAVEMELRRRRFGRAVRLEVCENLSQLALDLLVDELELEHVDVRRHRAPLALADLWSIHAAIDDPGLHDVPWPSVTAGRLAAAEGNDQSIFSVLRHRDLLVHHPYESFSSSTEEFLEQAANDPRVQGIKITLYRTSADSPIARSLIRAAETGKQVVALVELTARFDEATNVEWAKEFERVGVHVVYGVVGLKTHSKCVLVVRQEEGVLRRYVHVGTGNYNSRTARIYEDIGIFSCNEEIGDDVSRLFNALTGFSHEPEYHHLVVAPRYLRSRIVALIENEIDNGSEGRIFMKMNGLADPQIVELLYKAAEAGVRVDLVIRGICCLRPSDAFGGRIRVRSILGRYLEHSRMYVFGHGGKEGGPAYWIGSADMMPRNLDKRVEVLIPVEHPKHRAWIDRVVDILCSDEVVAFEMSHDGKWIRTGPPDFTPEHDAQWLIHRADSESQLRLGIPGSGS